MGGGSSSSASSSTEPWTPQDIAQKERSKVKGEYVNFKSVSLMNVWVNSDGTVVMPVDLTYRVISKHIPSDLWLYDLISANQSGFNAFFDAIERELDSLGDYLPWMDPSKSDPPGYHPYNGRVLCYDQVRCDVKRMCQRRIKKIAFEWNRKEFWKIGCEADTRIFTEKVKASAFFGINFRKLGPSEQAEKQAAFPLRSKTFASVEGVGLSPAAPVSTAGYAGGTREIPPYSA